MAALSSSGPRALQAMIVPGGKDDCNDYGPGQAYRSVVWMPACMINQGPVEACSTSGQRSKQSKEGKSHQLLVSCQQGLHVCYSEVGCGGVDVGVATLQLAVCLCVQHMLNASLFQLGDRRQRWTCRQGWS